MTATISGGVRIADGIVFSGPVSSLPIKSVIFSDMEVISTSLLMLNTRLTTTLSITPAKSYAQSILFGSD
jgi:hypothetical protein